MTTYDYKNQAWVVDGKYVSCFHHESMDCQCYGKLHEGEFADNHNDEPYFILQRVARRIMRNNFLTPQERQQCLDLVDQAEVKLLVASY